MKLNPNQEKAAQFKDGICAVIAVPGSGKTMTMMERIGILVNNYRIPPENILGLTFTKNAADEMRNRLVPILGERASRIHLSTIHSFCFWMLRNEGFRFDILSGKDQLIFVKNIAKKLRVNDVSVGVVLREISLSKNNMISVDEFYDLYAGDAVMRKVGDIYKRYDEEKADRMLKDFDDLLIDTYELLKNDRDVRIKYRDIFKHLLVDEYQDTNPIQLEIIKLLIGEGDGTSYFIVGDDHQAIFSFTGASVGNILNFKSMFPESEMFILNLNYRSTPEILRACQNLIRHNTRQIEKELMTENENGDDVIVLESSNEETEASAILTEIQDLVDRKGYAYADIAVLYRANFQSRVIEESLLSHRIPYHIQNGMTFYDRFEVRVLLDYLRFIANPLSVEGDEALARILNVPNRYISRQFVSDLEKQADSEGKHLYEILKAMHIGLPYIRKNVKDFIALIEPLVKDAGERNPSGLLQFLRIELDYDRAVTDEDIPSPDDAKIQNIEQLVFSASRFTTIQTFIQYCDSFEDVETVNNKDGISLMTVHKAKGLEFPVVMVIGMVEGILPSKKGDIEEERRICFVAISRAMKLLYLSYSHTYLGQPCRRSIFLDEILAIETQADDQDKIAS